MVPADEEEAVDRDALAAAISEALLAEEIERPWRRNPFEAATAVPAAILLLVARDFAPLEQRLADAAERLEAAPAFLDRAKALLDEPCPALWRQMAVGAAGGGAEFLAGTLGPLAAGTPLAGRVETAAAAAAQALRDFAGWLGNEHAGRFPDRRPVRHRRGRPGPQAARGPLLPDHAGRVHPARRGPDRRARRRPDRAGRQARRVGLVGQARRAQGGPPRRRRPAAGLPA